MNWHQYNDLQRAWLNERSRARIHWAPPERCEACGATSGHLIWHHWSYLPEHWFDCIGLCRPCHGRVHSGRLVEPRTGRIYWRIQCAASLRGEERDWRRRTWASTPYRVPTFEDAVDHAAEFWKQDAQSSTRFHNDYRPYPGEAALSAPRASAQD